jgi:thioredoxin 2
MTIDGGVRMAIVTCAKCGAKNRVDEGRAESMQPVCGRCGAALSASTTGSVHDTGEPVEVTDETLPRLVEAAGDQPVMVDCWAPWCPPCRMLSPTIDQLAAESAGRYVVAKLNTDDNPRTAEQYRIDGIPALLFFKGGRMVEKVVGLQSKQVLAGRLASLAT